MLEIKGIPKNVQFVLAFMTIWKIMEIWTKFLENFLLTSMLRVGTL